MTEKKFVIGDREKNEWISVFDNEAKKMEFKNTLAEAKEYATPGEAMDDLKLMQQTGFFTDLTVYLKEGSRTFLAGERDSYQPLA